MKFQNLEIKKSFNTFRSDTILSKFCLAFPVIWLKSCSQDYSGFLTPGYPRKSQKDMVLRVCQDFLGNPGISLFQYRPDISWSQDQDILRLSQDFSPGYPEIIPGNPGISWTIFARENFYAISFINIMHVIFRVGLLKLCKYWHTIQILHVHCAASFTESWQPIITTKKNPTCKSSFNVSKYIYKTSYNQFEILVLLVTCTLSYSDLVRDETRSLGFISDLALPCLL